MDEVSNISKEVKSFWENLGKAFLSAGFIIGMILSILGLVIIIHEFVTSYKIYSINRWPIIPLGGTIIDSYMENASQSITYSIFFISSTNYQISYRTRTSFHYEVNGKKYISTKLSYFEPWNHNPIVARIEFDKYQPGNKGDIIVNPNDPSEAFILNKPYTNYTYVGLGLLLSFIGLYIIYH